MEGGGSNKKGGVEKVMSLGVNVFILFSGKCGCASAYISYLLVFKLHAIELIFTLIKVHVYLYM